MTQKKFNLADKLRDYKRPTPLQFILFGVGIALAIVLFLFLKGFVTCWSLTSLSGMAPASCAGSTTPIPNSTNDQGTPIASASTETPSVSIPEAELPPAWDGASRVNVLLMGFDYGQWSADRACPCRSDSMIVLTIDPISKTAGMLSVQRDLWVNIPGFGYNKINSALYLGDLYKLPGGGPELARKTVEDFLGISIQYYVLMDFNAFITIIDDIDGIDVNVPEDITVDPLGQHNTTDLKAGINHMDGQLALAYARMRHTANDDIDRSGRQQEVILAVRDKMLDKKNFLKIVANANSIYNDVSAGVKTNFPSNINDIIQLGVLALEVPMDNIQKSVINYTMVAPGKVVVNGQVQDILKPYPDKIRELVAQIFGSGSSKAMAADNPTQLTLEQAQPLMQQEGASILVVNASGVEGVASKTADYLKSQGMNVVNYGNTNDYPDAYSSPPLPGKTMLIVHSGRIYAIQYLKILMNIESISVTFDPNAQADIVLAVGGDWASNNPMP
jgi:polyisoprenyl-teichoic acid--peptidoglycan teichoic acid transferase